MRCFAIVFVIACGHAPPHRVPHSDEIAIAGDLTARVETDASVSVTAVVTLDGKTAAGTARLVDTTTDAALRSPHVRLARARAWQALGKLLGAGEQGYEALRRAHKELAPFIESDSETHFLLVDNTRTSDPAGSYKTLEDVVLSDLHAYTVRFRESVR